MSDRHILLSVLFFQEPDSPDVWIAQALEHDIAAYGVDIPAATRALVRTLKGHVQVEARRNREPLSTLRPAPDMFWTIWRQRIDARQSPTPAESLQPFPAFMIPAVSHEPLSATH